MIVFGDVREIERESVYSIVWIPPTMPGFFGRLFGSKRDAGAGADREASKSPPVPEHRAETSHRTGQSPSDIIFQAMEVAAAGDSARAEKLYEKGIESYRRSEPDGVDFALGRYAAFLIAQDRPSDALRILEEATKSGTDIPAIWADYLQLLADSRDIDAFARGVDRMASTKLRVEPEFLLAYARRADREDSSVFAEAVARLALKRSEAEKNNSGRWAATGDLGRILENSERLEEAMQLWRAAFDEGSTDAETVNRLSMHLERAKDYAAAIAVVNDGLKRGLPANVEETLRKRLGRCEVKAGGKKQGRSTASRTDVAAYSVREGADLFELVFQSRLKPPIKDLEIRNGNICCLLASKDSTEFVDVDITTGSELRRVKTIHAMRNLWFAPNGNGIGVHRTAAIGKGPSLLRFVDKQRSVVAESAVPDATTEIAWGGEIWYAGCRDGYLYAFDVNGKELWRWQTPGAERFSGLDSFRPCPYTIAATDAFAVVSSMENIYSVSPSGRLLWHAALPNPSQSSSVTEGGITLTIEMHGMGPMASFVHVTAAQILVGSSQGKLYEIDHRGKISRVTEIGEGHTRPVLTQAGSVAAVWAKPSILFLDDRHMSSTQGSIDWPAGLTMLGADVVLWSRNDLEVIDRAGKVLSKIEFSKAITHVASHDSDVVCAAGVLVAFRRTNKGR